MKRVAPICPRCESSHVESTTAGQVGGGNIDTVNRHRCAGCGFVWKWAVAELAPQKASPGQPWTRWKPKEADQ